MTTPLLCASPNILDQSFPRDEDELQIVAIALGELEDYIKKDRVHLILTDGLGELIEEFDWNPPRPYALLSEIYRLLNQWFLQPHNRLVEIDVSEIENYQPHPLPIGSEHQGLVEFWSDEVGKILEVHDSYCVNDEFFIGIMCEVGFASEGNCKYDNSNNERVFPLVGPEEINQLASAYVWDVPSNIHQRHISFDYAYKNCTVIGAVSVDNPPGGSHYKVRFEGKRPWMLDPNADPIPERFLKELIEITGYPIQVIKFALIYGNLPKKTLRFKK